jgi:hypothetical protein
MPRFLATSSTLLQGPRKSASLAAKYTSKSKSQRKSFQTCAIRSGRIHTTLPSEKSVTCFVHQLVTAGRCLILYCTPPKGFSATFLLNKKKCCRSSLIFGHDIINISGFHFDNMSVTLSLEQ